jgi:hypothetical protein
MVTFQERRKTESKEHFETENSGKTPKGRTEIKKGTTRKESCHA